MHLPEARVGPDELRAAPVEAHADGAVVALAQALARHAEARQLVPARLQAARAGHAVALARDLGVAVQRLQRRRTDGD